MQLTFAGAQGAMTTSRSLERAAKCLVVAIVSAAATLAKPTDAEPAFTPLGDLPGGTFQSEATAVSNDGSVVVGWSFSASGQEAFRWTREGAMVGLGDLPGGTFFSTAGGVSGDGSIVVGLSSSGSAPLERDAFRWTQQGGMTPLGPLPGPVYVNGLTSVNGISADGSTVVGRFSIPYGIPGTGTDVQAFRWTSSGGYELLWTGTAESISADGSVLAGTDVFYNGPHTGTFAVRWTRATGNARVPMPPEFEEKKRESYGARVSADGSTFVATATSSEFIYMPPRAYLWTAAGGALALPGLPGQSSSSAAGVSGVGLRVVGRASATSGSGPFVWSQATGTRWLKDILEASGADLTGWSLGSPTAISADGSAIVGQGVNPSGQTEAWIARIEPEPRIALTPELGLESPGASHTVAARVRDAVGAPRSGVSVQFSIVGTNAGAAGVCSSGPTCTTDSNGDVQFTYASNGAVGVDEITARSDDSGSINTAVVFWDADCNQNQIPDACDISCDGHCTDYGQPGTYCENSHDNNGDGVPDSCEFTLAPDLSFDAPGGSHTVTAQATDGTGAPKPGALVEFNIGRGPNAGVAGVCSSDPGCTTDAEGNVQFTYSSNGAAGVDLISATSDGFYANPVLAFWDADCNENEIPDTCEISCSGFEGFCQQYAPACGVKPDVNEDHVPDECNALPECSDGIDNDGDSLVDMADPGCPFPYATIENPQCDDGIDNDGNGFTDFADSKCQSNWPYWETLPPCGLGAELTLVLPLISLAASRRRRAN